MTTIFLIEYVGFIYRLHFKIEDTFMMNSVKRAVADNGGYIPSAIYID